MLSTGPATAPEISLATGISVSTIHGALYRLAAEQKVIRLGNRDKARLYGLREQVREAAVAARTKELQAVAGGQVPSPTVPPIVFPAHLPVPPARIAGDGRAKAISGVMMALEGLTVKDATRVLEAALVMIEGKEDER